MAEANTFAFDPVRTFAEAKGFSERFAQGTKLFGEVTDEDVQIATTPNDEIWRQDKVTLHHYHPLAERKVRTPVLIARGLVGRYTMVDLQEDRSLVRNLLNLGADLYVVDWGNPNRSDCYLTLGDYVDGYLDECVNVIAEQHGLDRINLLGICEGGVFTTCYAALLPQKVQNIVLTLTPIDFHADKLSDRAGHGFINVWTRSLEAVDVDRMTPTAFCQVSSWARCLQ
jgi:polyhydroxyalkanoate synthase